MIRKKIAVVLLLAMMLVGVVSPAASATKELIAVKTDPASSEACTKYKGDKSSAAYKQLCGSQKSESDAENTVKSVLSTVFLWIGIIAVIVIIIGGVFYILSQGDPSKVSRAKQAILYALIGLIVSLLSFAIVQFVLSNVA